MELVLKEGVCIKNFCEGWNESNNFFYRKPYKTGESKDTFICINKKTRRIRHKGYEGSTKSYIKTGYYVKAE